jgi:2,4-dienoyl-CoA reductase-like NADH-dependent reductase (Old Yellow Enzyme family)/thioredoxin reductase
MNKELSRRHFLSGVGVAGLAAAGAGLVGCTPQGGGTDSGGTSGGTSLSPPDTELLSTAYLNPQDFSYRDDKSTDFKTLFSPLKIGSIEINNRMVKSAAGSATYINGPTDEIFEYYVNFAKGGVELIWVETIGWMRPEPATTSSGVVVSPQEAVDFCKKLVEECAKYGASLGFQMGGGNNNNVAFSKPMEELTKEEIAEAQDTLAIAAKWYKDVGFKAWEFHVTGNGGANQFLTRYKNKRTDEYGIGSLENRARFATETIKKVKQVCGNDFVIQMLVEAVTENDNLTNNNGQAFRTLDNNVTDPQTKAQTIEEGIACAKLFEAAGADAIHLRLGAIDYHPCQFGSDIYLALNGIEGASAYGTQYNFKKHWEGQLIGSTSGAGMLLNVAKRYKEAVNIPVGAVTYMDPARAPAYFEQALADGKVDYFEMTRPLTVDIQYVNKLRDGRIDEIAPCTRCLHCHIGSNERNREMGYCRVNALTQRVMSGKPGTPDSYELPPLNGAVKKVMVIGGGPGGMEAARVAAIRGHEVTLYEKNGALGGKLDFMSMIKGPHQNLMDLKAYLEKQLEINGVTVVLNKEVDSAFINSEAPDAVILATGGLYADSPVQGNNSVRIIDYTDFMTADLGQNVVIYGYNAQAWDCALWLTVHKKDVQIVTPNPIEDLDKQQSHHEKRMMTTALYSLGLRAWPGSSIKEVGDGQITIATDYGTNVVIPCDSIVNAVDLLPNKSLLDGVSVAETYAIGDCNKPYNIALAIQAGYDTGRAL